jgi:hydroxypyruvate reductase
MQHASEIQQSPQEILRTLFDRALDACLPERVLPQIVPTLGLDRFTGRIIVVGAGKASAAMAAAFENSLTPQQLARTSGTIVTRYGHAVATQKITILEASHPVPDAASLDAAQQILATVNNLVEGDVVISLISGGGSALLSMPAPGVSAEDKQAVNKILLRCGASIDEINCIRSNLSAVKGGRLALAAFPATIINLVISDIPGDVAALVASGPTIWDKNLFSKERALRIIQKYNMDLPPAVRAHMERETIEENKFHQLKIETHVIATPFMALKSAAAAAEKMGLRSIILSSRIEGDAAEIAKMHAGIALDAIEYQQPIQTPAIILSGGETTVSLKGTYGRGGRNCEFILALAIALQGQKNCYAIACDTDGVDGSEDNAGAIITPDTLERAKALGLDAQQFLDGHDSYSLFEKLNDLVVTGPTLTNVNDFRAILVL